MQDYSDILTSNMPSSLNNVNDINNINISFLSK